MAPRVLLIGGHGKVSLLLTPRLLSRSWNVTSIIRDASQTEEILARGKGQPGKIDVLVRSLDDIKSDQDAQKVLDEVKPDYVVWSAGAGGKGGSQRTYGIDRDAAKHFIKTSLSSPSITKFLLVSYLGSRRNRAPWWGAEEWKDTEKVNKGALAHYYVAKLEADEYLTALAEQRKRDGDEGFQAILLRPGGLSDEDETGKISIGKTKARGTVTRGDVADVAARLLARDDARGWFDLLGGEEDAKEGVERVVKERFDCIEGEDVEKIYARLT
ncbi:MAG: hypothetical protein M1827_006071 [Pycnora praestabilis]|nr:MAG: hypothetical protein M1827_006071 [Pycnora praestabilis]